MRFHVLGLGPTGSLVAFHLRRVLSGKHDVHLLYRTDILARGRLGRLENSKDISVEYNGTVSVASGFKAESMYQDSSRVYDLVFSPKGKLRLPSAISPFDKMQRFEDDDNEISQPEDTEEHSSSVLPVMRVTPTKKTEIDSLFVACRAPNTLRYLTKLRYRFTPRSTIVLFQQGALAIYEELCSSLFRNPLERPHFVLVANNHNAWSKSKNHIVHSTVGDIRFGIVPDGRRDFEKSRNDEAVSREQRMLNLDDISPLHEIGEEQSLYRSLRNTVAVMQSLDDLRPRWEPISAVQIYLRRRLVVNSIIDPLTTLLGCRNGELYGNESAQRLGRQICAEAAHVFAAEALGKNHYTADNSNWKEKSVIVPGALKTEALMEEWQRYARATGDSISMMLFDIRNGYRITDIEYLNGYLVKLGKQYQVHTGANQSLVDLVKLRSSIAMDTYSGIY